jgi:hypothetical protein
MGVAAAALCLISAPGAAQVPATPAKGAAALTVTYELKGAGVDRPASNEKNVSWAVENRYTVTAAMTAQQPSAYGAFHKPDAAEQAREAGRAQAVTQAAGDMQSMMEQAEKIMALCGDNEDCITRETMKLAQGIDPNSAQMQSAKANIAAASVMPETRYQLFEPGTQTGTYAVKETAHEAYYDAACSPATEAACAFDTVVSGEGEATDGGGATVFQSGAMAEIDYQNGSLILKMAMPGFATAKKTVTTRNPEVQAGTTDVTRAMKFADVAEDPVQVSCGTCQAASGTFEREISDELLGRPAKLVVTWKFSRS